MDPVYVRKVSLHLFRVLDEIGLNKVTIARRRRTFLYYEKVQTIYRRLEGKEISIYHFGSQTEGMTTPGLNSDLDTLLCLHNTNVLDDRSEWQQGKVNLLMLQENTAPGYCRLQLLREDIPVAEDNLPNEHHTYDDRGRVLMKNTVINRPVPGVQDARNGPARSGSNVPGTMDTDDVFAFPCRSWPAQADEFIRRHRRHSWPTRCLLQEAVEHGVFLVPVGHKLSPTEPLEWRISASSAERCLLFSLSIVHIKCYAVLKMLVKTSFVDPLISKCISSYHCKTAVLYCTENNEAEFWREDNLLQCVQQCLVMLLTWVTDGFCPHFIMPEENLFAGKVTVQNRDLLRTIFTSLIQSKGNALLRVCIDDLGYKLQTKISTEHANVPVLDSLATVVLVGELEHHFNTCIREVTTLLHFEQLNTEPVAAARSIQQKLVMLRDSLRQADKLERQAIQGCIELLSCWLGSLLTSIALSRKMRVPRAAIKLIRTGAKSDVSSILKLASVYFSRGDLHKVEKLLQSLEAHFCKNKIQSACKCYNKPFKLTLEFFHVMFVLRCRKERAGLFAHCLRFSPQEIHCAPPAIRNELFRAVGDDVQNRHPKQDKWMDLAAVDCLPYLHYLQYLTYSQLGKRDLQTRALHNLERCIREDNDFSHLETAWNLLGQCREMEQEPEAAMTCYRTSLEIRPRNNAANWHVQNLRYKAIRTGV